jgi:hypothetical protein
MLVYFRQSSLASKIKTTLRNKSMYASTLKEPETGNQLSPRSFLRLPQFTDSYGQNNRGMYLICPQIVTKVQVVSGVKY